jgi:hypothetical protein
MVSSLKKELDEWVDRLAQHRQVASIGRTAGAAAAVLTVGRLQDVIVPHQSEVNIL